jgi:hypothetical protein
VNPKVARRQSAIWGSPNVTALALPLNATAEWNSPYLIIPGGTLRPGATYVFYAKPFTALDSRVGGDDDVDDDDDDDDVLVMLMMMM